MMFSNVLSNKNDVFGGVSPLGGKTPTGREEVVLITTGGMEVLECRELPFQNGISQCKPDPHKQNTQTNLHQNLEG